MSTFAAQEAQEWMTFQDLLSQAEKAYYACTADDNGYDTKRASLLTLRARQCTAFASYAEAVAGPSVEVDWARITADGKVSWYRFTSPCTPISSGTQGAAATVGTSISDADPFVRRPASQDISPIMTWGVGGIWNAAPPPTFLEEDGTMAEMLRKSDYDPTYTTSFTPSVGPGQQNPADTTKLKQDPEDDNAAQYFRENTVVDIMHDLLLGIM